MTGGVHRKAVWYGRVSSTRQVKKGDGLESQRTRCYEFARMKEYEVVADFRDDASGGLFDRPGIQEMLSFLRKHRGEKLVVLIDDISRLARDIRTHLDLRAAISGAGGSLESPSVEFGTDSDSILVENLLASVSQHQRQKNGETTKNRMRARMLGGWFVFQAPAGYRYVLSDGRGMVLVRDEPVASVIQEALEGFASGRFESQADVQRFLQDHPLYPKGKSKRIHRSRAQILLNQPVYAGYVEAPKWDVSFRPGQHEALISLETYRRIQDRLKGVNRTAKRRNLNEDFPLRGFVVCDDCSTPLRSCWSKGRDRSHAYYLCQSLSCPSYGKSIRREKLEGEFATLLQSLTPSETLFKVVQAMLTDLWQRRAELARQHAKALVAKLGAVETQVGQLLGRILDATVPSVISAYENRVRDLEEEKFLLQERIASSTAPKTSFQDTARTALRFLSSPWKIWENGRLEERRAVLRLAFTERLRYSRFEGYRTANLSLPFNLLGGNLGEKVKLVGPVGPEPQHHLAHKKQSLRSNCNSKSVATVRHTSPH